MRIRNFYENSDEGAYRVVQFIRNLLGDSQYYAILNKTKSEFLLDWPMTLKEPNGERLCHFL